MQESPRNLSAPVADTPRSAPEDPAALYRALMLPRLIEDKMLRLIRQGRLAKWFSGYGQEAIAVGCACALEEDDIILPMHRNLGVWTTRGVPLEPLFCQLMGRSGGFTRGRDRSFHFGLPEHGIIGMISQLAAMLPVACGFGLAARLDGSRRVAVAFIGEGATREGDFHEALSLAAVWRLPVLFVVENNGWGLSTPTEEALPVVHIADAGPGYGIPSRIVEGNELETVIREVRDAADHARAGNGPVLLEMKTYRMRGHEEASGNKYVPKDQLESWARKDPVLQFEQALGDRLGEEDRESIRRELRQRIEEVAEWAIRQPEVEGTPDDEEADLYRAAPAVHVADDGARTEKRFIDAVSDGLAQALEEDRRVLLLGQDIAGYGGVFKVTAGFVDRFGPERIRNTPIIESGAVGAALGLALSGYRPIVEMQYADFISCGFNQIVNNLATTHYRWGAAVPVTIRAPFGGHIGAGPFHSQSMEGWFCHVAGLKVVIPSTPADAKGLLLASIDDPNPVLFFEHKALYRSVKGPVPDGPVRVPIGTAAVAREGTDATIVSWGLGVHWALETATEYAGLGRSIEVVDLRTLVPWDRETVLGSVRKTGRLLVLHEAARTGGFGGEIASSIAEEAFEWLDAPPVRVAGRDLPIPFARHLEEIVHSARPRLRPALDRLLAW
jgi:2-oxoisovalerate dehydrogenase E1 component